MAQYKLVVVVRTSSKIVDKWGEVHPLLAKCGNKFFNVFKNKIKFRKMSKRIKSKIVIK